MARPEEERYTDLLRHLASPSRVDADELVRALREVEHLHAMGHLTDWQVEQAREAYAETIRRDPRQGPPRAPETLGEDDA